MSARESRLGIWIVVGFVLVEIFFTGEFSRFTNPNELSRLETVYAVVEQGTFAIDGAIPVLGDHEDKAVAGGHFYSNKAPGLSLAAIPAYRLLRVVFPRPHSPQDPIFVLLRLLVVTSVCVLALGRLRVRLASAPGSELIVAALAFGTPFLFYARSFFSHAWTASLLFLAWDILRNAEEKERNRRVLGFFAASGCVAMWAAISEYPIGPVVALLALRVFSKRSSRNLLLFVLGALLPLCLLAIYNTACFGSPWTLSSAREASPLYSGLVHQGFFGFEPPSLTVAGLMLASPSRGLLLLSPFWVWALFGGVKWWRSGNDRSDAWFAFSACVLYFALLTGYSNWQGGWSLGNRYLLPIAFLAALSLEPAIRSPRWRGVFLAAVTYSVTLRFFLTATWPHFPPDFSWPVAAGSRWFLRRAWVAPNLLSSLSVGSLIVPAVITAACVLAAARSSSDVRSRSVIAAVIGVVLACGMLFVGPEPAYGQQLWRAAVFGAFSGRDPSRAELRRVVLSAKTVSEQRQALGAWRAYGIGDLRIRN